MTVTNSESGTNLFEVSKGIFRINTPVEIGPGQAFSFNQYLLAAEQPLLFHTGPRQLFPLVREAVEQIMSVSQLRFIAFAHVGADECGSLNQWLEAAPDAVPLCSAIGAMTQVMDLANRPPRAMADGDILDLGGWEVQWFDAPHVPHGWDNGFLFERLTGTLFCGDLFTQPGDGAEALTEGDILGPSEAFRMEMDYYAHAPQTAETLARLASARPTTLACMHGSAWRGDGGALIGKLAEALAG